MTDGAILIQLITTIGLIIPIGTLIWKAAKQSAKIEECEKRLDRLEAMDDTIQQINISIVELRKDVSFIKEQLNRAGA